MNLDTTLDVWCPTCGQRWPRSDARKPRQRCGTGSGCRGHLVSVALHPVPQKPPRPPLGERVSVGEATAIGLAFVAAAVAGVLTGVALW